MCFMGNMELLCTQCRVIGPQLAAMRKSHIFSRVAVEPWGTFSNYGGDGHSKLVFVQRHQDSYVVTRENSGISTRLDQAIGGPLEVMRETEGPFLVSTLILEFLSIFKKSQALSPVEALNLACLLRCQRDVMPPVQMRQAPRAFFRVSIRGLTHPVIL